MERCYHRKVPSASTDADLCKCPLTPNSTYLIDCPLLSEKPVLKAVFGRRAKREKLKVAGHCLPYWILAEECCKEDGSHRRKYPCPKTGGGARHGWLCPWNSMAGIWKKEKWLEKERFCVQMSWCSHQWSWENKWTKVALEGCCWIHVQIQCTLAYACSHKGQDGHPLIQQILVKGLYVPKTSDAQEGALWNTCAQKRLEKF